MKINNYQKSVLSWGILIFLGYVFQSIAHKYNLVILSWTLFIGIALFVQIILLWSNDKVSINTNILWIIISIIGGIITYVLWAGIITTDFKINVFWFLIVSIGMVGTYVMTRNNRYIMLCIIYALTAVIFQILNFDNDLIYVGISFLVLSILDFYLEYKSDIKNII